MMKTKLNNPVFSVSCKGQRCLLKNHAGRTMAEVLIAPADNSTEPDCDQAPELNSFFGQDSRLRWQAEPQKGLKGEIWLSAHELQNFILIGGKLEKILAEKVKGDRVVELLMTIPGTGLITASTVRAYVDEIDRFLSYKQFSSYAGLAPWVQNSNERERYGNITKRGTEPLRTALVQMVLDMVRNRRQTESYRLMVRYRAMKPHKRSGKTIIATARKLSKVVWYMLRRDDPFSPIQMTDPTIRRVALEMRAAVYAA